MFLNASTRMRTNLLLGAANESLQSPVSGTVAKCILVSGKMIGELRPSNARYVETVETASHCIALLGKEPADSSILRRRNQHV